MSDGAILAEAEGFVGEDEPTWFGGEVVSYGKTKVLPKRPDYAIRAMCQTRAMSRACRSAFAHVVVMMNAGLSTTPAEEVPDGGFDRDDDLDGTPQPRKSAHQARKDGDYERLVSGLRACKSEDDLTAWAAQEKDALGAIPAGWAKELREEWVEMRDGFRARAEDPHGLKLDLPSEGGSWMAYVEEVETLIAGAVDAEQVQAIQVVNGTGLAGAALEIEGVPERIAEAVERRLAMLQAKAA